MVDGRFFGHFFWKVVESCAHTRESRTATIHGELTCGGGGNIRIHVYLQLPYTVHCTRCTVHSKLTCGGGIHVWELLTCAGDIHVWELLTCGGDIHVWELFTCGEAFTCGGDIQIGPVHELTSMNNCCQPPEILKTLALTANHEELSLDWY